MKTKLIFILFIVLVRVACAVHNEVVDDIAALQRAGFDFKKSENRSTEKTICFTVQLPPHFAHRDYEGKKPFQTAAYRKPEDPDAKGFELISAKGAYFALPHTKEKTGNSVSLSVLRSEASGAYLEISFSHGPGTAPMLVHVPLKAIIAFLDQPTAQRAGADQPAAAPGSKPESKEKASPGKESAPR